MFRRINFGDLVKNLPIHQSKIPAKVSGYMVIGSKVVEMRVRGIHCEYVHLVSILTSFPGLPCLYLPFAFSLIHGSGRLAKNRKGLREFIT